ncbi:12771_t:CDS:2 [Cetraspora pellucida]|uniref:12771_t:CDS:1 n=1 Tax=Cetraspora pellucida TaxID=1433469 RepID=A0A9N8W9K9_9GLOM|nr:12771_t:CDS:2 [Cetraspora pellucida]
MDSFKYYFSLCLLIFLVWTSDVDGFAPLGRYSQSSALVGNKLYFFGSALAVQFRDNVFLDVTLSTLNTSNPSWSLSNASVPTNSAFASACVGGPNKNTIFLLEHQDTNNAGTNNTVVYSFDTVSSTWTTLPVSGTLPVRISGLGIPFNDIFILDTLSSVWTKGSSIGAPTARYVFSATLLNNGLILYIGGGDSINMAEIPTFNTNSGTWSLTVAVGDTINPRSGHTAVLSPDGHVIIYGGAKNNSALDQSQQLASLDTNVNPYSWSKKSSNGVSGVNNNLYNLNNVNAQLYLLDTRNYMWVTDTLQHPNSTNPQNPSVTQIQTVIASNSLNTGVIVAIPIVSITILAIIGLTGYWFYKKNKQNDVIRIAGSKYGY